MHIGVVFDLDVLSGSVLATADSGSIPTPSGNFGIAGDGDVLTVSSQSVPIAVFACYCDKRSVRHFSDHGCVF